MGCDCQHGIPETKENMLEIGFEESDIEVLPDQFRKSWDDDNDISIEEFLKKPYSERS